MSCPPRVPAPVARSPAWASEFHTPCRDPLTELVRQSSCNPRTFGAESWDELGDKMEEKKKQMRADTAMIAAGYAHLADNCSNPRCGMPINEPIQYCPCKQDIAYCTKICQKQDRKRHAKKCTVLTTKEKARKAQTDEDMDTLIESCLDEHLLKHPEHFEQFKSLRDEAGKVVKLDQDAVLQYIKNLNVPESEWPRLLALDGDPREQHKAVLRHNLRRELGVDVRKPPAAAHVVGNCVCAVCDARGEAADALNQRIKDFMEKQYRPQNSTANSATAAAAVAPSSAASAEQKQGDGNDEEFVREEMIEFLRMMQTLDLAESGRPLAEQRSASLVINTLLKKLENGTETVGHAIDVMHNSMESRIPGLTRAKTVEMMKSRFKTCDPAAVKQCLKETMDIEEKFQLPHELLHDTTLFTLDQDKKLAEMGGKNYAVVFENLDLSNASVDELIAAFQHDSFRVESAVTIPALHSNPTHGVLTFQIFGEFLTRIKRVKWDRVPKEAHSLVYYDKGFQVLPLHSILNVLASAK